MVATDNLPGGGGLHALAPAALTGDLSGMPGISWDELLPSGSVGVTSILLQDDTGGQRTLYFAGDTAPVVTNSWNPRFVPFDNPSAWTLSTGSTASLTFDEVIRDVDALYIQMDVTLDAGGNREAGVDNVSVIPIPAALPLFGTALAGLGFMARRRMKA